MMRRPRLRAVAGAALVLAVAIQFVPINRDNPPAAAPGLEAPAPIVAVLRRSCYDCHSHETTWPWYSYVAPVSWLVAHDVHDGRRHVDFSEWTRYSDEDRRKRLRDIIDEVQGGDMPLWYYTPMHAGSKLSAEDVRTISAWAEASGAGPAGDR